MKDKNKYGNIDHPDDFFFRKLDFRKKYPELSKVIIITLTLCHGQADIERGFSQNKILLQQNIKDDSISS